MTSARFQRVPGVRVEPIGAEWAAWSPASGETHVLNDQASAILEVMDECSALSSAEIADVLAEDVDLPAGELEPGIRVALLALEHSGFVCRDDNMGW